MYTRRVQVLLGQLLQFVEIVRIGSKFFQVDKASAGSEG